jgi:hypothetical protein
MSPVIGRFTSTWSKRSSGCGGNLRGFLGVVSQRLTASQAFQLAKVRDRKGLEIGALPGTDSEDLGREVPMSDYLAKYLVHASNYTELSL